MPIRPKDASLNELRRQYDLACEKSDTAQIKRLEAIFKRLGEPPRVSSLGKALNKRTK